MTAPILSMEKISKAFGKNQVLEGVDFELFPGEVHILAGENGAGKSTLIKILAGIHTKYEGSIKLKNKKLQFKSPQEAAQSGISVIHQELSLIPSLSVVDNCFLGREKTTKWGSVDFSAQRDHCKDLLKKLSLDISLKKSIEEFPISIQQMIEIAKALAFESNIIVMDEPTSALSKLEVEKLFGIIEEIKSTGCAIVYISHKMDEIYRIGDRITVLRDGKKIGTALAKDLSRTEMIKWMVGREVNEFCPRHKPQLGEEKLKVERFSLFDEGGKKKIVDNVSFSVRAGEILGIGGLQGSGNSELLSGLFGVYGKRTRGKISIEGQPYEPSTPSHAIKKGVALLTNDRKTSGLVLGMDITKNITLASLPEHSPGFCLREKKEKDTAHKLQEKLNIKTQNLDNPVETLSGGNQQKVVLAKWLDTNPGILLLDEPTRGVDVGAKKEIYELINQWTAEGFALILITSEMPELIALSDRIMVMHRGRKMGEMTNAEATQEIILNKAMGSGEDLN